MRWGRFYGPEFKAISSPIQCYKYIFALVYDQCTTCETINSSQLLDPMVTPLADMIICSVVRNPKFDYINFQNFVIWWIYPVFHQCVTTHTRYTTATMCDGDVHIDEWSDPIHCTVYVTILWLHPSVGISTNIESGTPICGEVLAESTGRCVEAVRYFGGDDKWCFRFDSPTFWPYTAASGTITGVIRTGRGEVEGCRNQL